MGTIARKRSTWVAWSMAAIYVACYGAGLLLSVANRTFQRQPGFILPLLLAFTAFMVVGAVIVAHRPGNAIGWIFCAIGLLSATGTLALDYAKYAYITRPGSLPGAVLAAWFQWWWLPMFALVFVFTPLLFPTGRLLSARWRPVAVAAAAAIAAIIVLHALRPTNQAAEREVHRPQPHWAQGGPRPGGGHAGRGAVWGAGLLRGRGGHLAGAAVSPLPGGWSASS